MPAIIPVPLEVAFIGGHIAKGVLHCRHHPLKPCGKARVVTVSPFGVSGQVDHFRLQRIAYRTLGDGPGLPLVLVMRFRGVTDEWGLRAVPCIWPCSQRKG